MWFLFEQDDINRSSSKNLPVGDNHGLMYTGRAKRDAVEHYGKPCLSHISDLPPEN